MRQKYIAYVDYGNEFGRGHGAVIVQGGEDKSKALLIAPNMFSYLEKHYEKLRDRA